MAVGTASYEVEAADLGLVPDDISAANANRILINNVLGDSGDPIHINWGGGLYWHVNGGSIVVPSERWVRFDLKGSGLSQVGAYPTVQFKRFHPGAIGKSCIIENGYVYGGTHDTYAAIQSDNTGDYDPMFKIFRLKDLTILSPYSKIAIYLATAYSVLCELDTLNTDSSIIWTHGREEYFTCSNMKIRNCHVQIDMRVAPNYMFEACRNLQLDGNIAEGQGTWRTGIDKSQFRNTIGTYIRNPGPNGGHMFDQWHEFWSKTDESDLDWCIDHFLSGSGGAAQSRYFHVRNAIGQGEITTPDDSFDVFKGDIDGCSIPVLKSGKTVISTRNFYQGAVPDTEDIVQNLDIRDRIRMEAQYIPGEFRQAPASIYSYRGGTGNDGGVTRIASGTPTYPHRHPINGNCLIVAFNSLSLALKLPAYRMPQPGKLIHVTAWVNFPHLLRKGGTVDNVDIDLCLLSESYFRRHIGGGFSPTRITISKIYEDDPTIHLDRMLGYANIVNNGDSNAISNPVMMLYGLEISFGDPIYSPLNYLPASSLELLPGEGPPPGTYGLGDIVYGRDRHLICSRPGTSRTLSFAANQTASGYTLTSPTNLTTLYEGDWIQNARNEEAQILTINNDNTITLDRQMKSSVIGIAFKNYNPLWKVL